MSEPRFVTVATYGEVYQADLAKAVLEEEGITVVLHDRETVSMDWLISNSVGGIKVKVAEEDGERAVQILEARLSQPGSYLSESLSEDELTRQAMAEQPEEGIAISPPAEPIAEADPESELATADDDANREEYARRFLRASVYSILLTLICFVFWFYAVYLGLNAIFSRGRLSSEGQRRVLFGIVACCGNIVFWLMAVMFLRTFLRDE